jgi:hypothetical protein
MTTLMFKSRGFSIISLTISSAIGVFVVSGVGKLYIGSKVAYQSRTAIAAATQNGRFAIQDLRRTIVMAGRGILASDDSPSEYALDIDNSKRTFPLLESDGEESKDSTGIVDRDKNGSSIIAIRYNAGPAPCGAVGTIAATTTVRYFVENNVLMCQVNGGATQPMVSGVLQMKVLYGIDLDIDDVANQYITAKCVENYTNCVNSADSQWDKVVSMRIGLIVNSDEAELPFKFRPANAEIFDVLGEPYTAPDTSHVFKSISTTITLRNLNMIVDRQ